MQLIFTYIYIYAIAEVEGTNFIAMDMTFQNTAGTGGEQKGPAVALRVVGDQSAFFRCGFDGFQDTLLAHCWRQFFRECTISGTIDFIWGNSAAVFQNCNINLRRPPANRQDMVTAQGREEENQPTGFVLQNCRIKGVPGLTTKDNYLGRPWRNFSRVIVVQSFIDGVINPKGWSGWKTTGSVPVETAYYGEYANRGRGASTAGRNRWRGFHLYKTRSDNELRQLRSGSFIHANKKWLEGIPFDAGFS
jgi:pectinesterase